MLKQATEVGQAENGNGGVAALQSEVTYRKQLQEIGNGINAAADLDDILIHLKDEIAALFLAERITIFVVDGKRRELVSHYESGDNISEIRLSISKTSLAGYAASRQAVLNVKDVCDAEELAAIDPDLRHNAELEIKGGFKTRQALVLPIIYRKFLLGVIQLINRTDGGVFQESDEKWLGELANVIGIAFFNHRRMSSVARETKFDYLIENNLLTHKELEHAIAQARQRREPVETTVLESLKIPKKEIGKSLSRFYRLPFVEFSPSLQIPGELLSGLKVSFMRSTYWVPLRSEGETVIVVTDDPNDLQKADTIQQLFLGRPVKFNVALRDDILKMIKLFTQDEKELAGIDEIISQLQDEAEEIEEAESSLGEEDSAVVQLVNKIIIDADMRGASDIHIEPYSGKQNTQVRLRVDGQCYLYQTIPYHYRNAVVSRIKIMGDLDIAERRKPQDGKIKFKKYGGKDIELRVATVPTQGRLEDVVLRLLAAGDPMPLDKIGFNKNNHKNFLDCVTKPYGIIFVCGPTGSGKTTTLHSALGYINKPETKIWTAEDPVEITQKGLRQVQVKPKIGFDFASAMRSFLRADPDVIMVGEMRDRETTQIGIEASLTGHLVFSTLHTNSAPESITRLLDMGMDPFNFADAILCILAQRLVLTLCKDCKKPYHPTQEQYDELVREYGKDKFDKNVAIPYSDDLTLYKPDGCDHCNQTGYRGRTALHELLMGTDALKHKIQTSAPIEQLRTQAINDGMTTLRQDGVEKVFAGKCDLLQVRKVTIK